MIGGGYRARGDTVQIRDGAAGCEAQQVEAGGGEERWGINLGTGHIS